MTANRDIGRMALKQAIMVRRELDLSLDAPIDVIDVAERLNVEVFFQDIPSMEGMYVKAETSHIFLPSDRPLGRQMFACAHELGHHRFGHGTRADIYIEDSANSTVGPRDPEETLADLFACHLLMPRATVDHAFQVRNWVPAEMTPAQAYVIAGSLGVSYIGFIRHLCFGLKAIDYKLAEGLIKTKLPEIRAQILGLRSHGNLVVADEQRIGFPVNLWVGDRVLLPSGAKVEMDVLKVVCELPTGILAEATKPGITRAAAGKWISFVRVCRSRYAGRSKFRFLEEQDAD